MEVSDDKAELCGQELVETVVSLSGLPELLIRTELNDILDQSEKCHDELTLEELRSAMLEYLEKINESVADQNSSHQVWEL